MNIPTKVIIGTCGHCEGPVIRDLLEDEWEPPRCSDCKRPTKEMYGPVLVMGELDGTEEDG
jgi:hypothetical protein